MERHKYLTLDGLRGVAALAVLFWHGETLGLPSLPSSYLAVDLFFMMSGFVIANAYEYKLLSKQTFFEFLWIRVLRLYPLYILGTIIGLLYRIAFRFFSSDQSVEPFALAQTFLRSLFFIPTDLGDYHLVGLFPLNGPAWSLFFELIINMAYAAIVLLLTLKRLILITLASCIALLATAIHFDGLNAGWNWATVGGGIPRVSFSFFAGVLIHRLHRAGRLPLLKTSAVIPALAVLGLLALPMNGPLAGIATFAVVAAGFPLVVLAAISVEPARGARVFAWAGFVSYPVYALHGPLIGWLSGPAKFLHIDLARIPWAGWILAAVIVAVAHFAATAFDEPIRRSLRNLFARKPKPVSVR